MKSNTYKKAFLYFHQDFFFKPRSRSSFKQESFLPYMVFRPNKTLPNFVDLHTVRGKVVPLHTIKDIQGVTGGMDKTSGECSLC